jgi:hypothetical protein
MSYNKRLKDRATPWAAYITKERMSMARRGGMWNFSKSVNTMVIDVFIERAKVKQALIDAAKKDFDADGDMKPKENDHGSG